MKAIITMLSLLVSLQNTAFCSKKSVSVLKNSNDSPKKTRTAPKLSDEQIQRLLNQAKPPSQRQITKIDQTNDIIFYKK